MGGRNRPDRPTAWARDHELWVELFVLLNFGGLVLDIYLAHSQNQFRRTSEYVPLYFSLAAAVALAIVLPLRRRWPAVWRDAGHCPYRRGYCPVAEYVMPRLLMVTVSTQPYEFHQRNAEALGRALARIGR